MITFAEARDEARKLARKSWEPLMGDLYISTEGAMGTREYAVFYGARQWIVDHSQAYFIPDLPVIFVDKQTGEARSEPYIGNENKIRNMTPLRMP